MLLNYTPHEIRLVGADGSEILLPSAGVARVASTPAEVSFSVDGIPVHGKDMMGQVGGLPLPVPGVWVVVSAVVGSAPHGRDDLLVLGTGPQDGAIRKDGQVWGVTRLKKA